MSGLDELQRARSARNAAQTRVTTGIAKVKADLSARSLKQRVSDASIEKGADAIEQVVDVANSNRAVIAGTVAALGLWFLRNPIIAKVRQLTGQD